MKVQVILSCMHEKDYSIVERSNIQTDVIVVNQCDEDSRKEFTFLNKKGESCVATYINTTQRGLSRSRNMCIDNATSDILIVCDDDEVFEDDYEDIVIDGYQKYPDASFMVFDIKRAAGDIHCSGEGRLGFKATITSSSVQMTFKRVAILTKNIFFDEKMGSGTGNGGGEENKFMMDIRRANLKMYSRHKLIARLLPGEGKWQNTTSTKFFENLGWTSRRWGGFFIGYAFIWYNVFAHRVQYRNELPFGRVIMAVHKGFFERR